MTTLRYFRSLAMALRQRKLSDDKVADVLRNSTATCKRQAGARKNPSAAQMSTLPGFLRGTLSPAAPKPATSPSPLSVVLIWRSIAMLLKLPEGFTYELTGQR